MRTARYGVRAARSEDLPYIAALDVNEFRSSSVGLDGLQSWFEVYPRGAFVLEDRGRGRGATIVGALGLWPVTSAAYAQMVAGNVDEREITASDICPSAERPRYKYWYLADIIVAREYRRTGLSRLRPGLLLLRDSLAHWASVGDYDDDVEVCAIAAGKEGEGAKLLEDFGFVVARSAQGTPVSCKSGDTIYCRSLSVQERTAILERIRRSSR